MCLFRKRKEYNKSEAQKCCGQLGRDLEHSPLSSAEDKDEWSRTLSSL